MSREINILVGDFETGGLDAHKHEPLSFACILLRPDLSEIARFDTGLMRVREPALLDPRALAVNGFTPEQIAASEVDPAVAVRNLLAWLDSHQDNLPAKETTPGSDVWNPAEINPVMFSSYNANFDWGFLINWLDSNGCKEQRNRFHYRLLDIQPMAWLMLRQTKKVDINPSRGMGIQTACAYFGGAFDWHTAMGDSEGGAFLLRELTKLAHRA